MAKATKVTTLVNGVPHTTTAPAGTTAAPQTATVNANGAPSRGQAGWIDPIRAPGDTKFTDAYGDPTPGEIKDASSPDLQAPMGPPTTDTTQPATTTTPQAPDPLQAATTAQGVTPGAGAPVQTAAASPTPIQNKYAAGMSAAAASGTTPPVDAGAARTAVQAFTPTQQPDTGPTDALIASDPGMTSLFKGINDLLSSQNQTSSLMDDYNKLYKQSGLADINAEIIDADTIINGTEDDIRNEIQTAGGFGTESQVQAMTLSRNKNLLKRYNQLVQMKTDATNQLNTLSQLNQQDKQMAQQKVDTQISAMFNMANFRQTALQNTRSQQQFMIQTMGADGYYASVSQDPRQLAIAEQILGVSPGGLQKVAQQAAQARVLDTQAKQASINASNASTANAYSNIAKNRYDMNQDTVKAQAAAKASVETTDNALTAIKTAKSQVGSSGLSNSLFGWIGGTGEANLRSTLKTIQGGLALDQLAALKANSPSGASGLGAASDREGDWLASRVASIDASQSPAQLKANLDLIQTHYVNYLTGLGYGYDDKTGVIITP